MRLALQIRKRLMRGLIALTVLMFLFSFVSDIILGVTVVLLPTAMGVICAMQALKPPPQAQHKRWFGFFIMTGAAISALVLWQQHRLSEQAERERKDLREELQKQIDRTLFQIKDVSVSFRIKVPLNHPALQSYRERVEKCAREIEDTQVMKCGTTPHTIGVQPNAPIQDFFISPGTELFPDPAKEAVAFTLLIYAGVDVGIFRDGSPIRINLNNKTVSFDGEADLKFRSHKMLDEPQNRNPANNTLYEALYYDIPSKSLFVEATQVPVDGNAWHASGKITSIPDLRSSLLIVNPFVSVMSVRPRSGNTENPGYEAVSEWEIAEQISRTVSLESITLYMSTGYQFSLGKDKLAARFLNSTPTGDRQFVVYVVNPPWP